MTRNFRGCARHFENVHFAQPAPPPSVDPPSAAIPPISRGSASLPMHQTSQRVDFCFECSLDRPIVTAFFTVTLREESPHLVPSLAASPLPPPVKKFSKSLDLPADIAHPSEDMERKLEAAAEKEGVLKGVMDNNRDEYWCRVVEEPLSPAHD